MAAYIEAVIAPAARRRYDRRVDWTAVSSLNVHATWACRHSGACCTAGWNIPVEPAKRSLLGTDWFVAGRDGACPQFDRWSGLCRIHRSHGEAMLPDTCHQFPRRVLTDALGTRVTLSHFCPTAATMLVDADGPLVVVANPPAFPATRDYDGLDASNEWPPLIRPDAMFDPVSYAAWEHYLIDTLGSSPDDVMATLGRIAATGERIRQWRAGYDTLFDWTMRAVNAPDIADGDVRVGARADLDSEDAAARYASFGGAGGFARAASTVPAGLTAPQVPDWLEDDDARWVAPVWRQHARLVLRYLGARTFASWTPYQSRGLRTQIAELFLADAILRVESVRACQRTGCVLNRDTFIDAVRASDLLLVHHAERALLMARLGQVEFDASSFTRR